MSPVIEAYGDTRHRLARIITVEVAKTRVSAQLKLGKL